MQTHGSDTFETWRDRLASQSIEGLVPGMHSMVDTHKVVDSVAMSSQRCSEEALELVRKERAEREKERNNS